MAWVSAAAAATALGLSRSGINQFLARPGVPASASRKRNGRLEIDLDLALSIQQQIGSGHTAKRVSHEAQSVRESREKVKLAIEAERLKQEQMETRRMAEEESTRQGNILPRDEWTQVMREVIGIMRDRFAALPKHLAKLASDSATQRRIVQDGTKAVAAILDQTAKLLEQGVTE